MHKGRPRSDAAFYLLTEIVLLILSYDSAVFASEGYPFKNIFDFTTAGDWDCMAAVERLPALHYCVDFIFLSFWDHGFHCGTLKLLEGH